MLTKEGIKQIIQAGEPQWVKDAKAETLKLQVHVNGLGVEEYLERIETYENKRQYELRKKYFTSNRHLFGNLLRHVDKVFTAQGGSKFYGISEDKKPELLNKLSDVRHGKGVRKWIESVQANKYYSDPSGLVFFEWTKDETYPTLKSINSIFNYQSKGRGVDWVVFMPTHTEEGEFYRVVDGAKDITVKYDGKEVEVVEQFMNPWGRVPAIINSDRMSPTLMYHESPVQDVIELADKYLRTSSVKNIYEFLHGFPLFWAYAPKCTKCAGTGLFDGDTCPSCNGDGNTFRKDVSDILKLRPPSDSEEPKLAPDIAGYVEPADKTWVNQRTELDWLWRWMHYTLWGTLTFERQDRETALGRFIDIQPVNDKLDKFSDAFEDMEEKMVQYIGEFYFSDYQDTAINYGRIYMLESPDDIYKRYMEAREKGSPKSLLDYFLTQYYQSEFVNDSTKLAIYTKAMKIEPYVHKTDEEILALGNELMSAAKIHFNEWFLTLTEDDILSRTEEQLKNEYNTYLNAKVRGESTQVV
jgi:hypothetical protein